MNLLLIRHAHSIKKDGDTVLTEIGVKQATLLAKRLSNIAIDKTYSSNYTRALQTYSEFKKITTIPHVIREELKEVYRTLIGGPIREGTPPEREENDKKRADEVFQDILKENKTTDTIAIFCHGNIIRYFLSKVLNQSKNTNLWDNIIINDASISIMEYNNNTLKIKMINNIEHLSREEVNKQYTEESETYYYH